MVLTKTQNDDRLISALRAEVALAKKQQLESRCGPLGGLGAPSERRAARALVPARAREAEGLIAAPVSACARRGPGRPPVEQDDELWRELGMLRRRCGEQRAQIERYEGTIQQLGDKLAAAQAAPALSGGAPPSASPMLGRAGSASRAGGAALVASGSGRSVTPPGLRTSASVVDGAGGEEEAEAGAASRSSASWANGGAARGLDGGTAGALQRAPSARGGGGAMTSVEVRSEALDVQLRIAHVEIDRLQELVQLLQRRIQELEDELADAREEG